MRRGDRERKENLQEQNAILAKCLDTMDTAIIGHLDRSAAAIIALNRAVASTFEVVKTTGVV